MFTMWSAHHAPFNEFRIDEFGKLWVQTSDHKMPSLCFDSIAEAENLHAFLGHAIAEAKRHEEGIIEPDSNTSVEDCPYRCDGKFFKDISGSGAVMLALCPLHGEGA